jgi:hypothetical protein
MKNITPKTETALAVQFITEPQFKSAVFTLAQASKFSKFINESLMEDGASSGCGSFVYHPERGLVAWVSPNGRVWEMTNEEDIHKGGKKEITGKALTDHFEKVFPSMQVVEYSGHTITHASGGHCALIFKGTGLSNDQMQGTELLIKGIAGSEPKKMPLEKAKQFIDSIAA